jgi:hypothetical protein
MSYTKILNVTVDILRTAANDDFMNELSHQIERKIDNLDNLEALPYGKPDIIELIRSIETDKVKFLRGAISAKRLYCDVDYSLSLFKIKHPEFDYLKDPTLNAYFS